MKHTIITLLATLGMTIAPAMATTIVKSGTDVEAIDNLVILGNTYDVTFGETVDTTFDSTALANSAAAAIRAALNSESPDITVGPSDLHFIVCASFSGPGSCNGDASGSIPMEWIDDGVVSGWDLNVHNPAAEFKLVGTPEPGVVNMVLPALALILVAARRRRRPAATQ